MLGAKEVCSMDFAVPALAQRPTAHGDVASSNMSVYMNTLKKPRV